MSDRSTLFGGVTYHNTGLKVLQTTETQRKTENIDDIYFRTGTILVFNLSNFEETGYTYIFWRIFI